MAGIDVLQDAVAAPFSLYSTAVRQIRTKEQM